MPYLRNSPVWVDEPTHTTPLSAARFNHMEDGIYVNGVGRFSTAEQGVVCDLTRGDDADITSGNTTVAGTTFGSSGVETGKLIQIQGAGATLFSGTTNGNMSNASILTANRFTCSAVSFTTAVIGRWLTIMNGATIVLRAQVLGVESATQLRLNKPAPSVITNLTWFVSEDHYTTIASSSSGTSATLTNAPSTTIKAAIVWYCTDDGPAIQATATAAESGTANGNVVYHYGASGIGQEIYLTKPTQFIGVGSRGYSDLIGHGTTRLRLMKPGLRGIVGAGSDTKMGVNGAMTSGSAILTDPNANFVAGDVGKNMIVYMAGTQTGSTDGVFLSTTILSRQSATQVTLNANAGATVTAALYTYSSTAGYNGGLVGPSVRNLHIEGGPGQICGVHLVNCSESILHEVCASGFSSGVGIFCDGGPSVGFANQVEFRSCYAIDCRIGFKQDRGAFYLTGQNYVDGNSNRVDCNIPAGMTIGIDGQVIDATGAVSIQAVGTAVKCNGRGGASGLWGDGFTIEGIGLMFDIASDGTNGSRGSSFGFRSAGNSNAGGCQGLKLRAGVKGTKYNPGFYLDSDIDMYGASDATSLQNLTVLGMSIVKSGSISDADFINAPIDGATGTDILNGRYFQRMSGSWKYVTMTGIATRVRRVATAQQSSGSTTLTLTNTGATIPVGHHILVAVGYGLGSTVTITLTDSRSNSYTTNVHADLNTGATPHSGVATAKVTTAILNGDTFTVTFSSTVNLSDAIVYEYSGVAAASHIDQTAGATGTSTSPSSGNITTTNASDVLVGVFYNAAATVTPGGSWTSVDSQDNVGTKRLTVLEQGVSTTGTYAATGTLSSSVDWAAVIASLKAA